MPTLQVTIENKLEKGGYKFKYMEVEIIFNCMVLCVGIIKTTNKSKQT